MGVDKSPSITELGDINAYLSLGRCYFLSTEFVTSAIFGRGKCEDQNKQVGHAVGRTDSLRESGGSSPYTCCQAIVVLILNEGFAPEVE
jgi:hypothetical protein